MKTNNPLHSSVSSLIEIDQEEAALKEQLQALARKKEEARKTEGERAKDQLQQEIPDTRVKLLGLLRTAQSLEIEIEDDYAITLSRIVKEAGASGVALSLVSEVMPDEEKLQAARDQLGKDGSGEIVELTAKKHLKESKGRRIYLVWNEKAESPELEVPESEVGTTAEPGEPADQGELDEEVVEQKQPAPAPAKQPGTKVLKR